MTESDGEHPIERRDRRLTLAVVFAFSLTLGISTLAIPLAALDAGYDAAAIGFLAATAGLCQLAVRFALPSLLAYFSDRRLIALAGLAMFGSFGLLLVSTSLPFFVVAQLFQGIGRGLIWTSSQTHIARSSHRAVERLVDLHFAGTAGTLVGPPLAGTLAAVDLAWALGTAAGVALLSFLLAGRLLRLPPFRRSQSPGALHLLRREGVWLASWGSLVGGGWFAMLGSYMPVILATAGIGAQLTGWLIAISEAAGLLILRVVRRVPPGAVRRVIVPSGLVASLALLAFAMAPPEPLLFGLLLAVGGATAAVAGSLAPALGTMHVSDEERGNALALTGMFRALALMGAPAAAGALLWVLPLGPAVAAVGALMAAPGLVSGRSCPTAGEPAG